MVCDMGAKQTNRREGWKLGVEYCDTMYKKRGVATTSQLVAHCIVKSENAVKTNGFFSLKTLLTGGWYISLNKVKHCF